MRLKLLKLVVVVLALAGSSASQQQAASQSPTNDELLKGAASSSIQIHELNARLNDKDPIGGGGGGGDVSSVQRVWTATSSGSLNELSPHMINKLAGADVGVPFLAAYALRPRLLGGGGQLVRISSNQAEIDSPYEPVIRSQLIAPPSKELVTSQSLQTGASSPSGLRSTDQDGLLPKQLANFNEFKVETSSVSKSEHRHKRKTVLKRRKDNKSLVKKTANRLRTATAGSKQKRSKLSDASRRKLRLRSSTSGKQRGSKRQARLRLGGKQVPGKRSRDAKKQLDLVNFGRLLLQEAAEKAAEDEATKGGSSDSDKRPFYSSATTTRAPTTLGDDDDVEDDGNDNKLDSDSGQNNNNGTATGDDDQGSQLEQPTRVGDADVDEDGDTVMVEPKFDGVDDDPEIPPDYEAGQADDAGGGNTTVAGTERDRGQTDEFESKRMPKRDSRGKPSDRKGDSDDDDNDDDDDDRASGDADDSSSKSGAPTGAGDAIGGGIGTTLGGGSSGQSGSPGSGSGSGSSSDTNKNDRGTARAKDHDDDDDVDYRDDDSGSGGARGKKPGSKSADKPGVVFADDDDKDDKSEDDRDRDRTHRKGSSSGNESNDHDDERPNRNPFDGEDRRKSADRKETDDYEEDDYIDTEPRKGKRGGPSSSSDGSSEPGRRDDATSFTRKTRRDMTNKTESASSGDHHCEHSDGHYNHHDHDHHDHDHHHHHDTIKWLEEAIPGQPGVDYPIGSKINRTDFDCSDQKWPGYYADVETRCQVSFWCFR